MPAAIPIIVAYAATVAVTGEVIFGMTIASLGPAKIGRVKRNRSRRVAPKVLSKPRAAPGR